MIPDDIVSCSLSNTNGHFFDGNNRAVDGKIYDNILS